MKLLTFLRRGVAGDAGRNRTTVIIRGGSHFQTTQVNERQEPGGV